MPTFFVRNESNGKVTEVLIISTFILVQWIGVQISCPRTLTLITSGASCPMRRWRGDNEGFDFYNCEEKGVKDVEYVLKTWEKAHTP